MTDVHDSMFAEAVTIIHGIDTLTASELMSKLQIGYSRASRLLNQLENAGYVGKGEGGKPRTVLHPKR